jgi:hypothetical protein
VKRIAGRAISKGGETESIFEAKIKSLVFALERRNFPFPAKI